MPFATALTPQVRPITSAADCYARSLSLGFTFPRVDDGRVAIGPAEAPPGREAELAAVRQYLSLHEAAVLAQAGGVGGLTARPTAPRKIGTDPLTGERMFVPTPTPEPEPVPLPPEPSVLIADVSSLLTIVECDRVLAETAQAIDVISIFLHNLPTGDEGNLVENQIRRDRLERQAEVLTAQFSDVRARKSELFLNHVDEVARQQEQAKHQQRVQDWLSGRSARPY